MRIETMGGPYNDKENTLMLAYLWGIETLTENEGNDDIVGDVSLPDELKQARLYKFLLDMGRC